MIGSNVKMAAADALLDVPSGTMTILVIPIFRQHHGLVADALRPDKWIKGIGCAVLQPPVSDGALSPPDLNDRKDGKSHLSGETNRSGGRYVGGRLILERSTEHGTHAHLNRQQYQKCNQAHQ